MFSASNQQMTPWFGRRPFGLVLAAAIVIFSIFLWSAPVYACTPTPASQPPLTMAGRVDSSDLILEGTVIGLINESGHEPGAVVKVDRYFKGEGPGTITINGFGSASICRGYVAVADHFLFFVHAYADGSLHANWIIAGEAVLAASAENVAEIIDVVGSASVVVPVAAANEPPEPTTPSATQTATVTLAPIKSTVSISTPQPDTPIPPTPVPTPGQSAATPIILTVAAIFLGSGLLLAGLWWWRRT